FFQAEDGIRYRNVTGVQRVLFRSKLFLLIQLIKMKLLELYQKQTRKLLNKLCKQLMKTFHGGESQIRLSVQTYYSVLPLLYDVVHMILVLGLLKKEVSHEDKRGWQIEKDISKYLNKICKQLINTFHGGESQIRLSVQTYYSVLPLLYDVVNMNLVLGLLKKAVSHGDKRMLT